MKQLKAILVGAGSRGARAYAPYALEHPDEIKFVAVAEPLDERREAFTKDHAIPPENAFHCYTELLAAGIEADVAFICTQDDLHTKPAIMALEAGYHLVLEKPMSNDLSESEAIAAKAQEMNREVIVCYVLRYTAFFKKIKALIDSGAIGTLASITLNENVGYFHAAHSYVRGNWRNEALSSPMLLAKSSHDMDILCWLAGAAPTKVSSFGSLQFFKPECAPAGAAARCLDGCAAKAECPYDCEKIYMDPALTAWPVNVITSDLSPEGRQKALKEGPYGRCVFHCDNDVVDRQVVALEFESGTTASFSMNSLSAETCRRITVYGTHGEIHGKMEDELVTLHQYGKEPVDIDVKPAHGGEYGHGGGDAGLMEMACQKLSTLPEDHIAQPCDALISHQLCAIAERARHNTTVEKL